MSRKEEFLSFFVISLALVASSVMIYMLKTPSITGTAVLENDSASAVTVVSLLILSGLMVLIGAIFAINNLHKETEQHKSLMINRTLLPEHPNMNLVNYIMNARRSGFDDKLIIEKLKEEGWEKEVIKKYL